MPKLPSPLTCFVWVSAQLGAPQPTRSWSNRDADVMKAISKPIRQSWPGHFFQNSAAVCNIFAIFFLQPGLPKKNTNKLLKIHLNFTLIIAVEISGSPEQISLQQTSPSDFVFHSISCCKDRTGRLGKKYISLFHCLRQSYPFIVLKDIFKYLHSLIASTHRTIHWHQWLF